MKRAVFILVCLGVIALATAGGEARERFSASDEPGLAVSDRLATEDKGEGKSTDRLDRSDDEPAEDSRAALLDRLFERLATASSKRQAQRIAQHIQRYLLRSGSPTIDLLMRQAAKAIDKKEYGAALDVLDAVVRLEPDYAEGWNRRATVYFMREEFGRSLADIERVLELEPRHWGALSGLAIILVQLGEDEAALEAIDAALAVHPFLEELKERREKLKAKVGGADI